MTVFAYIEHRNGVADDTAAELAAAAKRIDSAVRLTAVIGGFGEELDSACKTIPAGYAEIWKVANPSLAYPNAELVRQALVTVLPRNSIVLVPHDHFGIDFSPGLAVKLGAAFVSDIVDIESVEGGSVNVVRQEFGGQVNTRVHCDSSAGSVLNLRPGAFKPLDAPPASIPIVDKSPVVGELTARRRYLETITADAGDVDITRESVLVAIGRGLQEEENVAIAQELAEAMGAAVCCSRPVVDAKWMDKSRQVGTSGKTVKPKLYLACGISGAFQHLAGIKGNPLLIAINKNSKAPIFQAAEVGIVADVLEFLPVLTNKVRELRAVSAK